LILQKKEVPAFLKRLITHAYQAHQSADSLLQADDFLSPAIFSENYIKSCHEEHDSYV